MHITDVYTYVFTCRDITSVYIYVCHLNCNVNLFLDFKYNRYYFNHFLKLIISD